METYIKCNKNDTNLSDITYMSELILDIFKYSGTNKMSRINSPKQLTFSSVA